MGQLGKILGTALGAAAGTVIAPGAGTGIGAQLGSAIGGSLDGAGKDKTNTTDVAGVPKTGDGVAQGAIGIGEIVKSAILNRKAIRHEPVRVDEQEADFNSVLNNLRKGYYTRGGLGEGGRQLGVMEANSAENIMDASGGYTGGALAALVNNNAAFGSAFGNSVAAEGANENAVLQMYGNSVDKMVGRRADLDMMNYAQEKYDARNNGQAGFGNLATAFAGRMPSLLDGLHLMGEPDETGAITPFSLVKSEPLPTASPVNSAPSIAPSLLPNTFKSLGAVPGSNASFDNSGVADDYVPAKSPAKILGMNNPEEATAIDVADAKKRLKYPPDQFPQMYQ